MRYDVIAPTAAGTTAEPDWITEWALHAEACGFDGVVAVEHAVVFADYESRYPYDASGRMDLPEDVDIPDPLVLLTFLAGSTTTLGLATGVLVLPDHHPVVLAKRLATLSRLSNGRLRVCVGMGWMREEVEACGVDFDTRGRRADEQLEVLGKLWADGPADHDGEFFRFAGALSYPKPHSPVPVHVGGHTKAAARRAGRFGAGLQPLGVAGDDLARLVMLMRDEASLAGRDPEALELTLGHLVTRVDADRAGRLAAHGAVRLVLAASDTADLDAGQGRAVRMRRTARPEMTSIEELSHLYAAAVDARDWDAGAALFTEDGVLVVPDPPEHLGPIHASHGRAEIRAALAELEATDRTRHEVTGVEPGRPRRLRRPPRHGRALHRLAPALRRRVPRVRRGLADLQTRAAHRPGGDPPGRLRSGAGRQQLARRPNDDVERHTAPR